MLDLFFFYRDCCTFLFPRELGGFLIFWNNSFQVASLFTWPLVIYNSAVIYNKILWFACVQFVSCAIAYACCSSLVFIKHKKFLFFERIAAQLNFSLQTEFLCLTALAEYLWCGAFSFWCADALGLGDWFGLARVLCENIFYLCTTCGCEFFSFYSTATNYSFYYFILLFIQENLIQLNIWIRLCLLFFRLMCYQVMDDAFGLLEGVTTSFSSFSINATIGGACYSQIFIVYATCVKFLFELDLLFKIILLLNIAYVLLLILQRFCVMEQRTVA